MIDWQGQRRQTCPDCGRGQRDRTCGVTVEQDGSGVAHCFRCGYVETVSSGDIHVRPGAPVNRLPADQYHEVLSEFGWELWNACRPLCGEGLAYLEARCCVVPPADGHLRFHPGLKHGPSGLVGPALVALVTDAATGKPLTLHRTWVQADGNKARVEPARMLLGRHRKAGGVVRLWPDEAVTEGLGVAEGIETALSLAHAFQPVWACIDAGNLRGFGPLSGIESLVIGADHDEAGIEAARACARLWTAAECSVRIVMPDTHKTDLNDLAREAA